MADSSVAITAGSGTLIDTQVPTGGDHRQVVTLGSPSTVANVAEVSSAGALYVQGHQSAGVVTNIIAATTNSGPISATNYNIAMISIRGTHAGINLTWEISDDGGTTWFPCLASRDDTAAAAVSSGVITSNASVSWTLPIGAATHMRVRATAWTSGTGVVTVSLQSMPYEPIPSVYVQGTVPVSGSLTSAGTTTSTPATPTASNINSAASTNATSVKNSAGTLYSACVSNTGAGAAYLKFYNKASAPTVGTDVPVLTISVPASGTVTVNFGALGHRFATGIALALTGAAADSDTTAVAASQVKVLTSYV